MKVKVGDNVKVIAGKDKGKEGKILKTFRADNRVVVEGVNIVKKHAKPRTAEDKGGIVEVEASIHVSNVKVIANEKTKEVAKKETSKKTASKKEAK